jgi:signal transduction histidine kinase
MKAWPLRLKLTLWSALITGLALLTFGAGAAIRLYFLALEEIDDRLEAQAKVFFRQFPADAPIAKPEVERITTLFKANGELRGFAWGGPNAPDFISSERIEGVLASWPPAHRKTTVRSDGRFVRLLAFEKGACTLVLVASQKPMHEMLAELMGAYLAAFPVVLLVVGLGSWWMARRALQPIEAMTREVSVITASRLDRRIAVPAVDDEVGRHVRILNAMFDRLQASFDQATRFTADASHELRTPLTILRGEIEQALHASETGRGSEKLLLSLLEQTTALQKITDNLLLLARFDAGKLPLQRSAVNFSQLVAVAVEDAGMLASPQGITIEADVAEGIKVDGDALLLRRVLLNLVDNAVRYNRAGGTLRLALRREGGDAVFRIGNSGAGIPTERQAAIFERFFRAHEDRNSSTGGSGLGLSLCREILMAHGGRIALSRSESDWTELTVQLPACEEAKP